MPPWAPFETVRIVYFQLLGVDDIPSALKQVDRCMNHLQVKTSHHHYHQNKFETHLGLVLTVVEREDGSTELKLIKNVCFF